MKLRELDLSNTDVSDISMLDGSKLERLDVRNTKIKDYRPILSYTKLGWLGLPENLKDIDYLKKLPWNTYINSGMGGEGCRYWRKYDERNKSK